MTATGTTFELLDPIIAPLMTDIFPVDSIGETWKQTNQQTLDLFKANWNLGVNVQTGTTYTLAASDIGKVLVFTNASAITVTIPRQSNVVLPVGFNCLVRSAGAGAVTFVAQGSDVLVGNTATGANATSDAGIVLRTIVSTVNTFDIFGGA